MIKNTYSNSYSEIIDLFCRETNLIFFALYLSFVHNFSSLNRQVYFCGSKESFEPALYLYKFFQLFLLSSWNKIESQIGSLCSAVPPEGQIELKYINDVEVPGSHLYATCRGHVQAGVVPSSPKPPHNRPIDTNTVNRKQCTSVQLRIYLRSS